MEGVMKRGSVDVTVITRLVKTDLIECTEYHKMYQSSLGELNNCQPQSLSWRDALEKLRDRLVCQANGIKTLNCHRNPLVQKRGLPRIGCAKRCSSANLCQKKLCLIRQRTHRLNSHWNKHVAR